LKKWLLFLAFGCVGITTEIFFTAISSVVESILNHEAINWCLLGFSYIWMFPIYGLISFLAQTVLGFLSKYPLFLRMFIAAIVIFIVEFISGFILDQLTGSCPWEYKHGYHVMGYIQLEYLPAWMLFVFMIEKIYTFLDKAFEVQNT
jgi:uncharacterized membrane protein